MPGGLQAAGYLATPLQRALFQRLTGDAALVELLGGQRVYDQPPEPQVHPYVTLGEVVETPDNAHGQIGRQALVTLHVWTRAEGFQQGNQIVARLIELLDHRHRDLPIDGWHTVAVWFEQSQTVRDPDPKIRHAPVVFRVIAEQE